MPSLGKLRNRFNHRMAASNLSAYLDGELSARQSLRIERHLKQCAVCAQDLASLRETKRLLQRAPMQSVPRSFALPRSVQPEQAKSRRWSGVQSRLRVASVAVTFLLILALSGDALIGMGAIPLPDRPAASAATFDAAPVERMAAEAESAPMESAEAEIAAVPEAPEAAPPDQGARSRALEAAEAPQEEPSAGAPEAPMTEAPQEPILEEAAPSEGDAEEMIQALPQTSSVAPDEAPSEEAAPLAEAAPLEEAASEDVASSDEPRELEPNPTRVPPVRGVPAEGMGGAEDGIPSGQGGMGAGAAPSEGALGAQAAPESEAPLEETDAGALSMAEPEPPPAPEAAEEPPLDTAEAEDGVVATYAQETAPGWQNAPRWVIWRAVRLTSGILAGLLFLLLGGLVWAGYQRKV